MEFFQCWKITSRCSTWWSDPPSGGISGGTLLETSYKKLNPSKPAESETGSLYPSIKLSNSKRLSAKKSCYESTRKWLVKTNTRPVSPTVRTQGNTLVRRTSQPLARRQRKEARADKSSHSPRLSRGARGQAAITKAAERPPAVPHKEAVVEEEAVIAAEAADKASEQVDEVVVVAVREVVAVEEADTGAWTLVSDSKAMAVVAWSIRIMMR